MSRGAQAFKQTDVAKAIRAVESEGKSIAAVDFLPGGGFRVLIGEPVAPLVREGRNEWDDVLPQ